MFCFSYCGWKYCYNADKMADVREISGSVTMKVNVIVFGAALVYFTFSPQKELRLNFVVVRPVSP